MSLPTLRSIALSLVTLAAVACGPTPTEPSHFAEFTQTDLRLGTGDEAVAGRDVTVHYTLWLYNATATSNKGPQIETSLGDEPFTFELGIGQVIRGWDTGLVGMRVGGLRRLIIPPSQAYGPARSGQIPPDATLLFEIELLAVE
jgi:FKBP-type peptidyl-prolyl cis-trans isomerase FkpA